MKNTFLKIGLFVIILGSLFESCDDSFLNLQPKGNYISGYVQYADTNFATIGGYYAIALFRNKSFPFCSQPVKAQIIEDPQNIPKYYRLYWDSADVFYLAVIWKDSFECCPFKLLGTLGCDTSSTCRDYERVAFPNFTGSDYNIVYWADTSKKLN